MLSQNEGKTSGAHLLVGVETDAHFFRTAPIVSSNATGRYYQIIVPFNVSAELVVRSSFFTLSDAGGTPLSSTPFVPVTVPAGQAPTRSTWLSREADTRESLNGSISRRDDGRYAQAFPYPKVYLRFPRTLSRSPPRQTSPSQRPRSSASTPAPCLLSGTVWWG